MAGLFDNGSAQATADFKKLLAERGANIPSQQEVGIGELMQQQAQAITELYTKGVPLSEIAKNNYHPVAIEMAMKPIRQLEANPQSGLLQQ